MDKVHKDAYDSSISLLKSLSAGPEDNSIGFFASSAAMDNYKRVFTRDAFWMCMADILTDESELIEGCRNSFSTMARCQSEDGAIPSNVSPDGKVSYGIINPRIDPTTLFIIGCARFAKRHPEENIADKYFDAVEKAMGYLERKWESASCGLLYIPRAGNWADEYLQQGFVLYDEVLWHMALREYADILSSKKDGREELYRVKAEKVRDIIRRKFWVNDLNPDRENIYGRVWKKFDFGRMGYFLHFYFSPDKGASSFRHPCGIFDAFGNILAILSGVATEEHTERIISFIDEISVNKFPLVPAHYPLFPEETFRSGRIHQYRFKEFVGHFHNGGLWAWYTGPYVAALVKAGKKEKARLFLEGIIKANSEKKDAMDFYEYHTGRRAKTILEIERDGGLDLDLSLKVAAIARKAKSMVLIHFAGKKTDAIGDIELRALKAVKGDVLKVTAVGPDAVEVVDEISRMGERDGRRCFRTDGTIISESSPGGAPYLGVSAAACVIGCKAYFENKIIFE